MTDNVKAAFVILAFIVFRSLAYIIPSGKEPKCPSLRCQNGGVLVNETCTCTCSEQFMGLLCETEKQESKWPLGRYAIPTSAFGCPEPDTHGWFQGYINLTLPESSRVILWNDRNLARIEPHILGPFARRVMQLNFCVRRDRNLSDWPAGDYCFYRVDQKCPNGFDDGSIVIRGYEFSDTDLGGTLPEFETGNNTYLKLFFCCRGDGYNQQSQLGNMFPFVLFKSPASDNCQSFEGTEVSYEPVYMTNELVDWEFHGNYPSVNKTGRHVGIPYCYYKPYARRECYFKDDRGASYRGRTNVTLSGLPCMKWFDMPDDQYIPNRFWIGEFEENFCNTVDRFPMEGKPMCFTTFDKAREECDIPPCAEDSSLLMVGEEKPAFTYKFGKGYDPYLAVNGIIGGVSFSSSRPQLKPFLQVDLQEWYEVHAVVIIRTSVWFPLNIRYMGTFVSKYQWDFYDYGALRCDDVRNVRKAGTFRFQCRRAITGQYVTLRNFDSTDPDDNLGKFFYLSLNEVRVMGKATLCGRRLGMTSGDIFEYQMYTSSNINYETNAISGRVGRPGPGWCPDAKEKQPWYMVDLVFATKVEGLLIQGWNEGSKAILVKSFTLQYGTDEDTLTIYEDPVGTVKIFKTNPSMIASSIQQFILNTPIMTRYVKIQSEMPGKDACLKLEIIGCPKAVTRDVWCKNYTMDYGFEELRYHSWWMEELDTSHWLFNVTKKETMDICLSLDWCISYNYDSVTQEALLHEGHRYTADHKSWWVTHMASQNYAAHRLCFKDISGIQDCGGTVSLQSSTPVIITSPGFPFSYRDGINCNWKIQSTPGSYVELNIVNVAVGKNVMWNDATQGGLSSQEIILCSEKLIISGGGNPATTITYPTASQDKYKRTKIISSTSELQVTLKSCFHYSEVGDRNFELHAKEIDLPGCGLESGVCIITCRMQAAYIATSRFPAKVDHSDTCNWKLEGVFGQYVRLEIDHLDIEDNDGTCRKSYVSVYDVTIDGQITLMAKMCKSSRVYGMLISSWHRMQVEFRAGEANGAGFLGRYYLVDFTQKSPNITSIGCNDGWYSYEDSCYRMFSTRNNKAIRGVTWVQAEDACVKEGGHLASIGTREEMSYIHYLMTKMWDGLVNGETQMYIGLRKLKSKRGGDIVYEWTDGSPLTFTAWFRDPSSLESQPDGLMNERCTVIKLHSIHTLDDWHDVVCAYNGIRNYICEMQKNKLVNDSSEVRLLPINYTTVTGSKPFVCGDGVVISRAFICDGYPDCLDNSDEKSCGQTCSVTQFQCDSGECISMSSFCDFIKHCRDNSDEINCIRPSCEMSEWRCRNHQCIPQTSVCDLKLDCLDGTDEQFCDKCEETNFQCYDETCIRRSHVCDGTIDCSGNSFEDEDQQCRNNAQASCSDWFNLGVTTNGEYKIHLGTNETLPVECKFISQHGKRIIQTIIHHNQEEPIFVHITTKTGTNISYPIQPEHVQILMDDNECHQMMTVRCHFTIAQVMWHGGKDKRHELLREGLATDTCDCPFLMNCSTNNKRGCNCFAERKDWYSADANEERFDISKIVDEDHLPIDSIVTSPMTSRNRYLFFHIGPLICERSIPTDMKSFLCRSGIPVDNRHRCIMDFDGYEEIRGCRDLSHLENCDNFACPADHVKCSGHYCLPVRLLCDGIKHCQEGEDERGCDAPCPRMFHCHKSKTCIAQSEVCDGYPHCPEGDDERLCQYYRNCPPSCVCDDLVIECYNVTSQNETLYFNPLARKLSFRNSIFNDSVPNLEIFLLAELDMSYCSILQLMPNNFKNLKNLYDLDLSMNFLTRLEASTFAGLENLKSLNLKGNPSLTVIDYMAFYGLAKLPELTIHRTWVKYIVKGAFQGLKKIQKLNLTNNKISKVDDNAFKTLETLDVLDIRDNVITDFSDGIFKGLSNLTKLYTDAYVFCCLKPSTVEEEDCLPYRDEFSSCSDLMRNDILRLFLWVIGISSLVGNIGVVVYKIFFNKRSLNKSHNIFIANLGLSDLCMGIYLLIIAVADAAFRGKYLWNDISWRNGYMCAIAGVLATVSSEASVLFLFLITLDRLISIKFPFGQIHFNGKKAVLACGCVWLFCLIAAVLPLLPIDYFGGKFYSRSAVCLALPLTRDKPPGWQYGTAVFIFLNFILFLSIALGQIFIYREISATDHIIKSQRRTQDAAIARSLFVVVFSDFLCWFPVGVMGLMALSGRMIPGEVYAWTAVFILPINSALNPYLYTFSGIIKQRKNGNFRFGSKLPGSSKINEISSRRDEKWTEICQSDKFVLGAHVNNGMTLKELCKNVEPNINMLYGIVTDLAKSLEFLHQRGMIHGYINEENIIVCVEDRVFRSVHSKVIPSSQEKDTGMANDMEDFGRIVLKLLKWFQDSRKKELTSAERY